MRVRMWIFLHKEEDPAEKRGSGHRNTGLGVPIHFASIKYSVGGVRYWLDEL
jgi:hypothetical protein